MTPLPAPALRMPAEWEPHAATWLAFPHLASDWPGKLAPAQWAFVEFLRKVQERETVRLLVRNEAEAKRARSDLQRAGGDPDRLDVHRCRTDRAWLRDTGPTFVTSTVRRSAVCWKFDAWGKYSNWQSDAEVSGYIAEACEAPALYPQVGKRRVVLEGGSIDSNGLGTLLTTEECLLSRERRGGTDCPTREEYEGIFREFLGVKQVLWLGQGIAGDDTSGHVDTVARFVGPTTVVASVETDSRDDNYSALRENRRRLRSMRDHRGRPLDVVELPMPRPLRFEGDRLPATYANFYIANGCVLVPTYNDPHDAVALRALAECFPNREICGIHCVDLALGLGALHCLAQPEPAFDPRQENLHRRNRR